MKNKFIFGVAALALAMGLSSCDDFLDEPVRGSEGLDTYFSSPEEIEAFVGGCYFEIMKNDWWQIANPWNMSQMCTDDAWDGNTSQEDGNAEVSHYYASAPSNGILQNFWGARFQGINTCNTAIYRIPNSPVTDEALKSRAVAEARFLRAFFYFDLARHFGGVPILTMPTDQEPTEGKTRATQEEVYQFCADEFKAVAEILPKRSAQDASKRGHATRGAALGLQGKVLVYMGKYDEAKTVLGTLIGENEYDLLPEFGQVWDADFNNSIESLFEVQRAYFNETYIMGSPLAVLTGLRGNCAIGDGWAWCMPTSDLENAYINAGDTERLRWTIVKTGCSEIAGENRFEEYVERNKKMFPGGIEDASWIQYKELFGWQDDQFETCYFIDPAIHKSSRFIRKFYQPLEDRPLNADGESVYGMNKSNINERILRYADVLLLMAEACNETQDDGTARTYLNRVRSRAGLPDVTASGDALRQAIRLERRLELAFEWTRLDDIRRWKGADGRPLIESLMGPNGSFVLYNTGDNADPYEAWNQGELSTKGERFTSPRDLLWPIPLYEIQHSNGAITQNPGY